MPLIDKICLVCKNKFQVPSYREHSAKYCSKECHGVGLGGSTMMNCDVCGKEYKRRNGALGVKVSTCSQKCYGISQRSNEPPKNDIPAVKLWLKRRNMIVECEDCGYDEHPEILVIHHRDRNRQNNSLFNLAILCPNCHALEHYSENKEGWGHASKKRRKSKDNFGEYPRNG